MTGMIATIVWWLVPLAQSAGAVPALLRAHHANPNCPTKVQAILSKGTV